MVIIIYFIIYKNLKVGIVRTKKVKVDHFLNATSLKKWQETVEM